MKIIGLTDVHGRTSYPEKVTSKIRNADITVIAGDITNFGGYGDAECVINILASANDKILAVHGNCDQTGAAELLIQRNMNLHGTFRTIGEVQFLGIGGCNKTPFHTPQEYSEEQMKQILKSVPESPGTRFRILISHSPPFKTKVDRMLLGIHVGSKAIREYIETSQPDIVLCGHIHEARGIDQIGRTLIINPGPFPKHYVVINTGRDINYTLY